jgi:hypothetical protein
LFNYQYSPFFEIPAQQRRSSGAAAVYFDFIYIFFKIINQIPI